MAAGDYKIMRNASNTDAMPNAATGDLLLLWDTAVANVGSGITYSSGIFTLGETGHFLVMYSERWGFPTEAANERRQAKVTLTLAGVELDEGWSQGYLRLNSTGADAYICSGAAVIEVTTTTGDGDELEIRSDRSDTYTDIGGTTRIANDRSGVTIIKLDDDQNFARYSSASSTTTSATDNVRTVMNIQTNDEENSPFSRTGNLVDIATNNMVLACYSLKSTSASGRSEYQGDLELAGVTVPGSIIHSYQRANNGTALGGGSLWVLLEPTTGQDLEMGITSREGGGESYDATLQLWELPSGAETIIVEATGGNYNTVATDFAWDTLEQIDTDAFTHTAGQANIDVDNADDYLVACCMADFTTAGTAATRAVPAVQFRVETTDLEYAGGSVYNRNNGTADHSGISCSTLLTGLSVNDSIVARCDRLGTNSTAIACATGAMSAIRLSSLFPAPEPPLEPLHRSKLAANTVLTGTLQG